MTLLNKAVEDYAYSKELFKAWAADTDMWRSANRSRPGEVVKSDAKWNAFVKGKPESQVLMFLRKQIGMRVIGCGWLLATRVRDTLVVKQGLQYRHRRPPPPAACRDP